MRCLQESSKFSPNMTFQLVIGRFCESQTSVRDCLQSCDMGRTVAEFHRSGDISERVVEFHWSCDIGEGAVEFHRSCDIGERAVDFLSLSESAHVRSSQRLRKLSTGCLANKPGFDKYKLTPQQNFLIEDYYKHLIFFKSHWVKCWKIINQSKSIYCDFIPINRTQLNGFYESVQNYLWII